MFFIVGTRPRVREQRTLTMVCWNCSQPAAHRLTHARHHITFFFIPIIPLRARYFLQCLLCGANQELDEPTAQDILTLPGTATRTGGQG